MDPHLLEHYNKELAYLRELGQEFAEQYPKIANRLGMNGVEVADPYVERLLQGASFLTARLQHKLDAQFPHVSNHLLDVLYPQYLAPTPSMAIVQLRPRMSEGSLIKGFEVPRHSLLASSVPKDERTTCEFRTAHDVTLWPLAIVDASCSGAPPDLPLANLGLERTVKGAIRIRLKVAKGMLSELALDQLTFYLDGPDDIASRLHEILFAHAIGVIGCEPQRPVKWFESLSPETICAMGFDREQSLIPSHPSAFQGFRQLHEYFSFPARFLFFTLTGLRQIVSRTNGDTLDLTILLDCPVGDLEKLVGTAQFSLFCTPIINLFPKRCDAVEINPNQRENRILADKNRPADYEIYSVSSATGQEIGNDDEREFRPFFSEVGGDNRTGQAYYVTRREQHLTTEASRRGGLRTTYVGSEIFMSLVDRNQVPIDHAIKSVSVETLCTNRDLVALMPLGGPSDFRPKASMPVEAVKVVRGPTAAKVALAEGAATWPIVSHLDINYLTLNDTNEQQGAQALRELLSIYAPLADLSVRKQIDAITHINVTPVIKRLPAKGQILIGRGVRIDLTVDEAGFAGTSPYLLGSVLEQVFPRHVGQNSFTETALRSLQRGEIGRWKLRMGARPIA